MQMKKEDLFTIISTTAFILSYYLLRAIFESIEWSSISEWSIIIFVSGTFLGILNILLSDKKYKSGGIFSFVYFSSLIAILCFQQSNNISIKQIPLQSQWITKEPVDTNNVMIDFFAKDSLALIYFPNGKRIFGYVQDKGKLKVFDEYEELIFDWKIKFENDKFSVEEDGHSLTFYKKVGLKTP